LGFGEVRSQKWEVRNDLGIRIRDLGFWGNEKSEVRNEK
jgi:hypothetical protein